MNMFDEAQALRGTMKMCNITQSELAKKLGVSQSYIANKLRLLKLGDGHRRAILDAELSERHARALLRLEDDGQREQALSKIRADKLNVAETEALVDFLHNGNAPKRISRATQLSGIDMFKSTLKSSLAALSGLGIDTRQSTNYYGTKTYITICIDEG